jgi:hypothetical protein
MLDNNAIGIEKSAYHSQSRFGQTVARQKPAKPLRTFMNSQTDSNLERREFVTEVLDETRWPDTLALIVQFLGSKGVEEVRVEFGFVAQRDLRGERVPEEQTVPLHELDAVVQTGLQQGTIEWAGTSDFVFSPVGTDLKFTLCNDADLHFSSPNVALLTELSRALSASGLNVYE